MDDDIVFEVSERKYLTDDVVTLRVTISGQFTIAQAKIMKVALRHLHTQLLESVGITDDSE